MRLQATARSLKLVVPVARQSRYALRPPVTVVQTQLDAYNAKDIEALLATYAPDAEQYMKLHG